MNEIRQLMVERQLLAARANEDGLGVTGATDELLRGLLAAAQRAMERRFAPSTRKLDKSYWRLWCEWCEFIGTPPLRANEAANKGAIAHLHDREKAIALGAFVTWVADNPQYKVASMFNRLKGVARRHKSMGVSFVSLAMVAMANEGLIQEHIDVHGRESLLEKSKEPFEFGEIVGMLSLPRGTRIVADGVAVEVGDNLDWQGVVVQIHLFCTAGIRKEGIAVGPDEVHGPRKFSLHELTYRHKGKLVRTPTMELCATFGVGDGTYLTPVPCKNDQQGTKYGNNPIPSDYHPTRTICFAR